HHGHPSLPSADEHFGGSMETNVVLRSDGHIMWDSPAITKSSCKVDVSYFPFASFYIFNLLLPCIMVSFLAPLGFYLPADSGEKVSLGVTVLLALTVFQLLWAESMPPSESVPLIGKYYIATMTMITASTALTIFIMNVHHCGPGARPVPPWARRLILHHMARLCCVYEVGESCKSPQRALGGRGVWGDAGGAAESAAPGGGRCPWDHCLCHHDALVRNVGYIAGCFRRHRANQRRTGEWKKVARVMDRFFMWVFFLMVFLMSVLVLGNAA
ncbi:Neuronal acetylcholine receptor subunit alpha-10, partial [Corvus brachyrhynchos]